MLSVKLLSISYISVKLHVFSVSHTLLHNIMLHSLHAHALYSDLGVFIGEMDENGFAFKSGKLQYNDRVLACNGVDFTKEHTTQQVKDIFYQMAQEPLLRMAISRGVTLPEVDDSHTGDGHVTGEDGQVTSEDGWGEGREEVPVGGGRKVTGPSSLPTATSASASVGGASVEEGGATERGGSAPEPPKSPRICECGLQSVVLAIHVAG